MELTNINSVSDLINANSEMTPIEKVVAGVKEMEPKERLQMTMVVLDTLREFCVEMTVGNIENTLPESHPGKAAAWADDAAILRSALKLLNDVEL